MDGGTLDQVSSLYLILPTLAAVLCITLFLYYRQKIAICSSKKSRLPTAERLLLALLLICYFVAYFYLMLSYRSPTKKPRIELSLFWSYHDAFSFSDGAFKIRRLGLARQILLNILVYVPIGLLMPVAYHRLKHPFLLTFVIGFLLSTLTEVLQYIAHRGLCELDDILNNSLGCLLGVILWQYRTKRKEVA